MKITFDSIKIELTSHTRKTISVDKDTKKTLRSYGNYYKEAVKNGEIFVEKSTKKYGGNPLPWEPGGDNYFPIAK